MKDPDVFYTASSSLCDPCLCLGYAMVSASVLALSAVCHFSVDPEEAVISSRAPVT